MKPLVWVFVVLVPSAAAAQVDQSISSPSEEPTNAERMQQRAQPDSCAGTDATVNRDDERKSGVVEDAGSAAANTGGAIAGGAVAGPIGAAVGGVLVDHVGHAIKKVVGGGKKKRERDKQLAQRQACLDAVVAHASAGGAEEE